MNKMTYICFLQLMNKTVELIIYILPNILQYSKQHMVSGVQRIFG